MTRRELLGLVVGAVAAGEVPRSMHSPGTRRRYRADATIIFLSIPFYSRSNVGGGWAAHAQEGGRRVLKFAAGSLPQRARGLNRLGFVEEEVLEADGIVREAAYFGFMTFCGEENIDEAKRALESAGGVPYAAIEGRLRPGDCRSRGAEFHCPPECDWTQLPTIESAARTALRDAADRPVSGASQPAPFLYALAQAMHSREKYATQAFVYGTNPHELRTEKEPDAGTGRRLQEKGLTRSPDRVQRLEGRIRNLNTGKQSKFTVWFEQGETVPLRFDVKVRSFLRLTFEAET